MIGAVVLLAWAWFLSGFLSEPSAVGRSALVLTGWVGTSAAAAAVGVVASIGVFRRERWARPLAAVAAAGMTLTCVGAAAGIPALVGLASSRGSSRN